MERRFAVVALVVVLLVGVLLVSMPRFSGGGWTIAGNVSGTGVIKLGVAYPLTGSAASWGEAALDGALVAVDELNDNGGVNGRRLELVVEDTKCEPLQGVSAVRKLVGGDGVKYLIGDICSSVVVPAGGVAEQSRVLMMAQGSSPEITSLGDFVFRNWPSDAKQGEMIAAYAFSKIGLRRLAIINVNNPYGKGLAGVVEKAFKQAGGKVVLHEEFNSPNSDFRSVLAKAKAANPDALYVVSEVEDAFIARQARELGIGAQILGADTISTQTNLDNAQGALEGAVFSRPFFDENSSAALKFAAGFNTRFGKPPGLFFVSAHGYDAVKIVAGALDGLAYEDVDGVKARLYATRNYPGASGSTSFDSNGDVVKPYGIYAIRDGREALLQVG